MERVTFTLFTDTGGILLLDPAGAAGLGEEFVRSLDVALDPEGGTEQAVEFDGNWPVVWAEAVSSLRRLGAGGEFALVLSGEGTFHVRVQSEELTEAERARLAESFEERLRVRSGRLALTDGREIFGEELPGEGTQFLEVPAGLYAVHIHHLDRPQSLTPTVGVYGSEEHPSLVLRLVPIDEAEIDEAEAAGEAEPRGRELPRLRTSRQGYEEPRPGWGCYAQVTGVEGGQASLELMLTETVYSGQARMSLPEGEELRAGDYVLVRLIEDAGSYWRVEWMDEPA
ncbi:MAG TPA: hypothetical protein VEY09_04485 [Pyrinomonadaceae bacterium]|nr:hypothetical protein [Pyrinomonadaceae bacterium]